MAELDAVNALVGANDLYNQTIWAREDSAVQRRVADLKAAGLSPILAANGYGASAGGSSQSPVQAYNAALDYLVGTAQAQNSALQAQASMMGSQAALMNAQNNAEQLAYKMQYDAAYLALYAAASGVEWNNETGKWEKVGSITDKYNLNWFKEHGFPTTFSGNFGTFSGFGKAVDADATSAFVAGRAAQLIDEAASNSGSEQAKILYSLLSPPKGTTHNEFVAKQKSGPRENANILTKLFSTRQSW